MFMTEQKQTEQIKQVLVQTAKVLRDDVSMFRQLVRDSEGGALPPDILEKQAILREIENALTHQHNTRI